MSIQKVEIVCFLPQSLVSFQLKAHSAFIDTVLASIYGHLGKVWGFLGAADSLGQLQEMEIPTSTSRETLTRFQPWVMRDFLPGLPFPVFMETPGYFLLAGSINGLCNSQKPTPFFAVFSMLLLWVKHRYFLQEWTSEDRIGFAAVMTPNLGGSEPQCFMSAYAMCSSQVGRGLCSFPWLSSSPRLTEQLLFH